MKPEVFQAIAENYADLRIAVVGDFCLDRYFEIDPARAETSIETGLPVHNAVNVRPQPGGAGTIVNNLSALGIGAIYPIGFAGEDGEGFELWRALERLPGVRLDFFLRTDQRRTFTYGKPLVLGQGAPVELNRLDIKNWTPTPALVQGLLVERLRRAAEAADAVIALDQVDVPETGVLASKVREALGEAARAHPDVPVLADSRRNLRSFPPAIYKMNASELAGLVSANKSFDLTEVKTVAANLAKANSHPVFVTLAQEGIVGALPSGTVEHVPALPLRGEIDVVGAGDAVSANLAAALAAGADLRECLELAMAAGSIVIHKLGTTGTASLAELREVVKLFV